MLISTLLAGLAMWF
ncbi:hypothetical protein AAAC51_00395 [Priestia megaterium]